MYDREMFRGDTDHKPQPFTSRVSRSAVRIRHYPVTVSAEKRAWKFNATGVSLWEGSTVSMKRESGDRPGLQIEPEGDFDDYFP